METLPLVSCEEFYFVASIVWPISLNKLNLSIWILNMMYMIHLCVYIHVIEDLLKYF